MLTVIVACQGCRSLRTLFVEQGERIEFVAHDCKTAEWVIERSAGAVPAESNGAAKVADPLF